MCGRYNFSAEDSTEIQRIIKDVSNSLYGQRIKTGEIFPTNIAPAITAIESEQRPTPMMWGFPHYKGKGVIINAKSETVTEKKMFRDSVIHRRCVIPSTGFYEWGEDNNQLTLFDVPTKKGNKNKYLFNLPKQSVLYMAGFYKLFEGEDIPRFIILTAASNNSISDIHDRMPVIIKPDKQMEWLENDADFEKVFDQLSIRLERKQT